MTTDHSRRSPQARCRHGADRGFRPRRCSTSDSSSRTALFLALFSWIGGFRRALPVALGRACSGAFVLLVIFMRVAYISLPLGDGPFRSLSRLCCADRR